MLSNEIYARGLRPRYVETHKNRHGKREHIFMLSSALKQVTREGIEMVGQSGWLYSCMSKLTSTTPTWNLSVVAHQ